jgi:hypothetical protein
LEVAGKDDIQHRLHLRQVFLCLRQLAAHLCLGGAGLPSPKTQSRSYRGSWASSTSTATSFWRCAAPSSRSRTP